MHPFPSQFRFLSFLAFVCAGAEDRPLPFPPRSAVQPSAFALVALASTEVAPMIVVVVEHTSNLSSSRQSLQPDFILCLALLFSLFWPSHCARFAARTPATELHNLPLPGLSRVTSILLVWPIG